MFNEYPYGLLGDDFNILNLDDLASNACIANPTPFTQTFSAYPYWQCFKTQRVKLFCDGHGYDADAKDFFTTLVVEGTNDRGRHKYVSSRAISFEICQDLEKKWRELTRNEKYVCVSGPFTKLMKQKDTQFSNLWVFDKFKTKKGCASYFYGDCSLKYQLKNGCKLKNEE
jgi:hypothetical protein